MTIYKSKNPEVNREAQEAVSKMSYNDLKEMCEKFNWPAISTK